MLLVSILPLLFDFIVELRPYRHAYAQFLFLVLIPPDLRLAESFLLILLFQAKLSKKRSLEDPPPVVKVLWGGTGTGKSWLARTEAGPDAWIWTPSMDKWFDGYEGQDHVILEEYRGQLPFGMLLSLLDRYSMRVPKKGSSQQWTPTHIWITSPVQPSEWYTTLTTVEGRLEQLTRRISEIKHMAIRYVT